MRLRWLVPLFALALGAAPALAQVNLMRLSRTACRGCHGLGRVYQGAVSQGGTGPGADLHLEFPLFNRALPTRAQVQATLVYDSLFWEDVNGAWRPAAGGGWWVRSNQGHLTESQQVGGVCGWTDGDGTYWEDRTWDYYLFSFTLEEPDGSVYPVGTATGAPPERGTHPEGYYWDCPTGDTLPETFYPGDGGKGYDVVVSGTYDSMTGVA
jgi:hypothetical protein